MKYQTDTQSRSYHQLYYSDIIATLNATTAFTATFKATTVILQLFYYRILL